MVEKNITLFEEETVVYFPFVCFGLWIFGIERNGCDKKRFSSCSFVHEWNENGLGSGMKMVGHMVVFVVEIWKFPFGLNRANISNAS